MHGDVNSRAASPAALDILLQNSKNIHIDTLCIEYLAPIAQLSGGK